jgi:hypothetical protein
MWSRHGTSRSSGLGPAGFCSEKWLGCLRFGPVRRRPRTPARRNLCSTHFCFPPEPDDTPEPWRVVRSKEGVRRQPAPPAPLSCRTAYELSLARRAASIGCTRFGCSGHRASLGLLNTSTHMKTTHYPDVPLSIEDSGSGAALLARPLSRRRVPVTNAPPITEIRRTLRRSRWGRNLRLLRFTSYWASPQCQAKIP